MQLQCTTCYISMRKPHRAECRACSVNLRLVYIHVSSHSSAYSCAPWRQLSQHEMRGACLPKIIKLAWAKDTASRRSSCLTWSRTRPRVLEESSRHQIFDVVSSPPNSRASLNSLDSGGAPHARLSDAASISRLMVLNNDR